MSAKREERSDLPATGFARLAASPAIICLLLLAVTSAVYWPVITCKFTNFDDPFYVTDNPQVLRGLTGEGLIWAFTKFYFCNWQPATWLSYMLDCQIYGLRPWGYHLTNLLWHLANTLLLFLALKRLTGTLWHSALAAALFALHPLHVESVAWVADRKDLLGAFFFMITLWAYGRYAESRGGGARGPSQESEAAGSVASGKWRVATGNRSGAAPVGRRALTFYVLALVGFGSSLMSKQTAVTLPFVLLLLDYWPLGRASGFGIPISRSGARNQPQTSRSLAFLVWEKLPFFVLTVAASIVAYWAQQQGGGVGSFEQFPVGARGSNALVSYVRYLWKTFWPSGLAVFYPYPEAWPWWQAGGALLLLIGVTVIVIRAWPRHPYLAVGWFWYVGTLVPVIGLVQIGNHAVADRYTYIPLIGVFIMFAWGAAEWAKRLRWASSVLAPAAAVLLIGCGACAALQLRHWKDSETLFGHCAQVTPDHHYTLVNLGAAQTEKGKLTEATACFAEALRLKPDYEPAHLNLGNMLRLQGKLDEAAAHYQEALRLRPDDAAVRYNYGTLLAARNRLAEAEPHLRAAARLKSGHAEPQFVLGHLLYVQGKWDEAIPHYERAIQLKPDYGDAHYFLGTVLARQKKWAEAVGHFRAAIKASPEDVDALRDLAWILVTQKDAKIFDPTEGIRLAERACELTANGDAACLDTLAAAYSASGRFGEAVRAAQVALALAKAAGQGELARQIEARLQLYQADRPYHEGSTDAP